MKTILLLFFVCVISNARLFAQTNYAVNGSVNDSSATVKLINTTICVLNAKDSTLVKFTRADVSGHFEINNLHKGKFILLITYPAYADFVEQFQLDSVKSQIDFGKINLTLKEKLLKEVMIKGQIAAIKIKGETTEYNATAFKIQPNAKVEDLLKQLPGIQVDKDGKITAQGQTVNKVLVDGEEFFGDDPTLVTKNLRADMVDKVQLYDKKSDQATFTGVDDGEKTKTINIKLKEDKKKGYFGKIDAGAGNDQFYEGQGMFNYFKAKMKFSAYGTISNTGKTGLGWQDNSKYGSTDNVQFGDNGGLYITGGGRDELESFDGRYSGQGIPAARTGGSHFDSKWNNDKESINGNYKIGYLDVNGNTTTLTQNNLPGGVINSNSAQTYDNSLFRQKLDAVYTVKIDTTSNLKISVDGTLKNSNTKSQYQSASFRSNNSQINSNARNSSNSVDNRLLNASVFYTKKFKKAGRTFSLTVSEKYNQSTGTGYLKSQTDIYNTIGVDSAKQLIDEYKTTNASGSIFGGTATYTEPITKTFSVVTSYSASLNDNNSDRKSYDGSVPGAYDVLNTTYSNNFGYNQLANQGGAVFNYKKNKTIFNFGTKVADVSYDQQDLIGGTDFKRSFVNWSPQAMYQYRFSQQKSFSINYNGSTRQPSISQIQPVYVNTDPLNITLGNPNLKPSFTNRFNFNYNSYKVLSGESVYLSGNYSYMSSAIVNNTVTDYTTGKSTYQSVNLGSNSPANYGLYGYYNKKLTKADMYLGANVDFNGSTSFNFINNALNKTTSYNYNLNFSASKYKEKKYDLYISGGPTYTVSRASLQTTINNNGWGAQGNAGFNFYLPAKFQIGSDDNYQFKGATQTFSQDFNQLLINLNIGKKFFKDESLKLSLACNDLLNQNKGFDRSEDGNMITQTTNTTIKRYFMFSITWDFSKMGGAAAPKK